MKRKNTSILILILYTFFSACQTNEVSEKTITPIDTTVLKKEIATLLDSFNAKAASADFNAYFNCFTKDGVFIGTDATEYWNKSAFEVWAKPYFDKKTTWKFKALQRNIYFGKQPDIAWFDELLQTQMKICRGSGVVVKQNNEWKIQQYVLSTTIPNSKLDQIVAIKANEEDSIIQTFK